MLDNSLGLCNSFLASDSPSLLDVLVEIGQGTLLLTYANNPTESAEPGDLVWVPVRQRLHAGLVMAERPEPPAGMPREQLQTVKNLILKGAFSRVWHQMIGWCAEQTHTSLLQVLRTALPRPAWHHTHSAVTGRSNSGWALSSYPGATSHRPRLV